MEHRLISIENFLTEVINARVSVLLVKDFCSHAKRSADIAISEFTQADRTTFFTDMVAPLINNAWAMFEVKNFPDQTERTELLLEFQNCYKKYLPPSFKVLSIGERMILLRKLNLLEIIRGERDSVLTSKIISAIFGVHDQNVREWLTNYENCSFDKLTGQPKKDLEAVEILLAEMSAKKKISKNRSSL